MAGDDLGAFLLRQLIVGVDRRLVFCEEDGVGHLADVVIEGTGTYEQSIGTYPVSDVVSQVTHRGGVLECARGYLTQFAEQSAAGVG